MRNIDIHVSICWATDMYDMYDMYEVHMLYSQLIIFCGCKGHTCQLLPTNQLQHLGRIAYALQGHILSCLCVAAAIHVCMCDRHMYLHYCTHTITYLLY